MAIKHEETETYNLLSVMLPDNIESEILKVQRNIFQKSGHPSALALPPVYPICFLESPLKWNQLWEILKKNRHKTSMTLDTIGTKENFLFLTSSSSSSLIEVKKYFLNLIRGYFEISSARGCIPCFDGFYLSSEISSQQDIPCWNLSSFLIAGLRIEIHSGIERWWENCEWETMFQVKNK